MNASEVMTRLSRTLRRLVRHVLNSAGHAIIAHDVRVLKRKSDKLRRKYVESEYELAFYREWLRELNAERDAKNCNPNTRIGHE